MLKKKGVWVLVLLMSLLFIATGCSQETDGDSDASAGSGDETGEANGSTDETVDDGEVYEIVFAHVVRPTTAKGQGAERFAELIEERSNGRITVNVYPDSQLGSDREITEQMQSGTVHMNAPFTGVLPSFVPQFQVFDLPFLFSSTEQAYDAMHGDLGEVLNEYLIPQGLYGLGYWDGGFKHFTMMLEQLKNRRIWMAYE